MKKPFINHYVFDSVVCVTYREYFVEGWLFDVLNGQSFGKAFAKSQDDHVSGIMFPVDDCVVELNHMVRMDSENGVWSGQAAPDNWGHFETCDEMLFLWAYFSFH